MDEQIYKSQSKLGARHRLQAEKACGLDRARFTPTISYGKKKPTKGAFGNKNKKKQNKT
jgi:hypothetical protein